MTLYELFVKISGDNSGYKRSMGEAVQSTEAFGKTASAVGARIATALGFSVIAAGAVNAARKFEEAGVQIQRSTGATGAKLDALNESFANIYKNTSASSELVTTALSNIYSRTNLTGKALEDLTLGMIRLAKTQREDVGQLTPLVTRVFGDWSIATNKQVDAMRYLQVVSQQSGTAVSKLSETVVYAGAPLRMLGYSFEQSAAMIGKFEKEGVNTELVLGGMKAALQKFAKEGVQDVAAEWRKFVAGVQDGSITLQDALALVGAKRGPDLYRAIKEGRFEIDEMVKSAQKLAEQGGENVETFRGKITKLTHELEVSVKGHEGLIVAGAMVAPMFLGLGRAALSAAPSVGILAAKLELFVGGLGMASTSYATMIATGVLRVAGWAALAVAIYQAANAYGALGDAQAAAGKAGEGTAASLDRLEKHLQSRGVDISDLKQSYTRGLMGDRLGMGEKDAHGSYISAGYYKYLAALQEKVKALPPLFAPGSAGNPAADGTGGIATSIETIGKALEAIPWQKATTEGAALNEILGKQQRLWMESADAIANFRWAFEQGNLELPPMIAGTQALSQELQDMIAPEVALGKATMEMNDAWAKTVIQFSKVDPEVQARGVKDLADQLKVAEKATGKVTEKTSELQREFRKAFDHMARGIADSIVEWKGFGATALSVVKDLAKGILEILVQQALKGLSKALMDIVGQTGALGKALSSVLGIAGGGVASSAANVANTSLATATSIDPSIVTDTLGIGTKAAGGASKAASGAVSSITGIVGAVGSVVSAVSGVIGNFQMSGMNKSLDLIEHETRYTHLILQAMMDLHNIQLPKLESIWQYLWTVQADLLNQMTAATQQMASGGVKGGSGGGTTTVNVYLDSKKIWSGLASQAQLQGI